MAASTRVVDALFELHERLGVGGMGEVYRATNRINGRSVALKLVARNRALVANGVTISEALGATSDHSGELRLALAREFQMLSSLHHPHVVQVLDYGFDDELGPYFTMELLATPRTVIDVGTDLPVLGKVRLLAQVLLALAYLHRRGIVHRDLKPSNILCAGETIKVVDFGLAVAAAMARTTGIAGTPEYMAPELLHGQVPTVRSDLYALGVIAEELLSGLPPVGHHELARQTTMPVRGGLRRTVNGDVHELVPETLVPPELQPIVERLKAWTPGNRYASASDVIHALSRAVGEPLPVETEATRESFLVASDFVGRQDEIGRLRAALHDSTIGRGSSWLVAGESGVGKSRLGSELRTLALVQGLYVVHGRAVAEGGQSYEVWIPVLRALVARCDVPDADAAVLTELIPDLPEILRRPVPPSPPLPMGAAQTRLFTAVEALVRRQQHPTLVLLDDLQWAGADSILLLRRLSASVPELPLVLIGNYRDDEAPELARAVPAMRLCRLGRLSRDDVARLSASMLGGAGEDSRLVDFLWHETEGNVFFLVEIVRALAESAGRLEDIRNESLPRHVLTSGIERLVRRRIERVPASTRLLLDLAATRGRRLDFAVLHEAAPGENLAAWLAACAEAAVLEIQAGGEWYFAHDKLREAVLARLDLAQRRALHRRVGEAIERVYTGGARDVQAAALAHHFQHADEPAKAWTYHTRAGDLATRSCSYGQARGHYAAALAMVEQLAEDDDARRHKIDTLIKQVYAAMVADPAERNLGRMAEALGLLDRIAGAEPLAGADELRRARVNLTIGRVHFYSSQPGAAIEYFQKVVPVAEACGDRELAVLSSFLIGTAYIVRGDAARAEPLLRAAIDPIERTGEPFEWFRAVGYRGLSLVLMGRYREGVRELERIVARARDIQQPSLLTASNIMAGTSYLLAGDSERALVLLRDALRYATQTGDKLHLNLAWSGVGWAASYRGLHDEALASRLAAEDIARTMGGRVMLDDWYRAGDAEISFNAGRYAEAETLARSVAETGVRGGLLLSQGVAERVWGDVLALDRRGDEADAHMERSLAAFAAGGADLQAAHTRVRWAVQLRQRGDAEPAANLFVQAHADLVQFGCAPAIADAEQRWAAVGGLT